METNMKLQTFSRPPFNCLGVDGKWSWVPRMISIIVWRKKADGSCWGRLLLTSPITTTWVTWQLLLGANFFPWDSKNWCLLGGISVYAGAQGRRVKPCNKGCQSNSSFHLIFVSSRSNTIGCNCTVLCSITRYCYHINTVAPRNTGREGTNKFHLLLAYFCYCRIFVIANIGNKKKWLEGTKIKHSLHVFFYKQRVYKHTQPQIREILSTSLSTPPASDFEIDNKISLFFFQNFTTIN